MTDCAQGVCDRGARVITTPLMYWQTVGRNGNLFWQIGAGESSPGIMKRGVGGWGVPPRRGRVAVSLSMWLFRMSYVEYGRRFGRAASNRWHRRQNATSVIAALSPISTRTAPPSETPGKLYYVDFNTSLKSSIFFVRGLLTRIISK